MPRELVTKFNGGYHVWTWEPARARTLTHHAGLSRYGRWNAPGLVFAESRDDHDRPYALFVFARDEPLVSVDDGVHEIACALSGNVLDWRHSCLYTDRGPGPGIVCLSGVRDRALSPRDMFWMTSFAEMPVVNKDNAATIRTLAPRLLATGHYAYGPVPRHAEAHYGYPLAMMPDYALPAPF